MSRSRHMCHLAISRSRSILVPPLDGVAIAIVDESPIFVILTLFTLFARRLDSFIIDVRRGRG